MGVSSPNAPRTETFHAVCLIWLFQCDLLPSCSQVAASARMFDIKSCPARDNRLATRRCVFVMRLERIPGVDCGARYLCDRQTKEIRNPSWSSPTSSAVIPRLLLTGRPNPGVPGLFSPERHRARLNVRRLIDGPWPEGRFSDG